MSAVPSSPPQKPGLLLRAASAAIMAGTGMICRGFLYGLNTVETTGLDRFLSILDARRDIEARQRGLLTVCNHVSVLDDPLVWGVLPLRYTLDPTQLRWGLGAHDICYANSFTGRFFNLGQTLPTHRLRYSPFGGLYQPTISQAIRLLSTPTPGSALGLTPPPTSNLAPVSSETPLLSSAASESSALTFSSNGTDRWPAPSAFAAHRNAWVHIFPEGAVHQQRDRGLRYFKWGVARLILESEPAPAIVPMFIDGPDRVMDETRGFPRFLPRIGNKIRIVFGDVLPDDVFADLRQRWRQAVSQRSQDGVAAGADADTDMESAATQLRIETALRMRREVLKLRRRLGYPDEDPALALAETWSREPNEKKFHSNVDDSLVSQK